MFEEKLACLISTLDGMAERDEQAAVEEIIRNYAKKSVKNTEILLSLIPDVCKAQVKLMTKVANDNYMAAEWLCNLRCMKLDRTNQPSYFAAMVPAAMVLFPNGTAEGSSPAKKKFFDTFVDLYRKEFDWKKDGHWAESFDYTDFFKLLDKNIQEGKI